MTLDSIPLGTQIFLDANPLVYHFVPDPVLGPACKRLMDRIDHQEIAAFTTTHVLSDLAHRLMTMEAISRFGWPKTGIAQRVRSHPGELQKLTNFMTALDEVRNSRIQILATSLDLVVTATRASHQFALLSGDALVIAVMQANGLTHLVSHDADFDRVPGITRYSPA